MFQKIDLTGREPEVSYSLNPKAWQWWIWLAGRLVAVVVGLWIGISFVAGYVFKDRLQEFHTIAKPEIEGLVIEKLQSHEKSHVTMERVHKIENQAGRVDERLQAIEKQLDGMDRKLDQIIRNGGGHAGGS